MSTIKMRSRGIAAAAAAALCVAALSACSGTAGASQDDTSATTAAPAGNTVTVTLGDNSDSMYMNLDPTSTTAGSVTFVVTNDGEREHEFVILDTDYLAADLPFDAAADEALEETDGVVPVDEIESIMAGETKSLTVDLESGHYALICNIERHYRLGMRADFNVQ